MGFATSLDGVIVDSGTTDSEHQDLEVNMAAGPGTRPSVIYWWTDATTGQLTFSLTLPR
jgi:hypothetical protein